MHAPFPKRVPFSSNLELGFMNEKRRFCDPISSRDTKRRVQPMTSVVKFGSPLQSMVAGLERGMTSKWRNRTVASTKSTAARATGGRDVSASGAASTATSAIGGAAAASSLARRASVRIMYIVIGYAARRALRDEARGLMKKKFSKLSQVVGMTFLFLKNDHTRAITPPITL